MLPDRPSHYIPDLPQEFDDLICALLTKDPGRRPSSVAQVLEVLAQVKSKAERKGLKPSWPADPGDASGPMPALSEDSIHPNAELEPLRPIMSRPWVVIPAFLAVVGIALTLIFWPKPTAEELYAQAEPLMQSTNPNDWEMAWTDYLEPLKERYPNSYSKEVAAFEQKRDDHRELRRAFAPKLVRNVQRGELQRIYDEGLQQVSAGNDAAARTTWTELIQAYGVNDPDNRWIVLAKQGLERLSQREVVEPSVPAELSQLLAAISTNEERKEIVEALKQLYRDNPAALAAIEDAQ